MNTPHRPDQDFDARAQALHGAALRALSPATLARLRAARHPPLATRASAAHRGWWWATACSAVLAVGLGLHLSRPAPSAVEPVVTASAESGDEWLEQNPDLYVWLASDNALAMEQTR